MLTAIIIISVVILTLCVFGVLSFINFTINFKTDTQKRNKNIIIFAACCILVLFLGGLNTVFIAKFIYDNRSKIVNTVDELINTATDKTVEHTVI